MDKRNNWYQREVKVTNGTHSSVSTFKKWAAYPTVYPRLRKNVVLLNPRVVLCSNCRNVMTSSLFFVAVIISQNLFQLCQVFCNFTNLTVKYIVFKCLGCHQTDTAFKQVFEILGQINLKVVECVTNSTLLLIIQKNKAVKLFQFKIGCILDCIFSSCLSLCDLI
jgi:hypothetical protein